MPNDERMSNDELRMIHCSLKDRSYRFVLEKASPLVWNLAALWAADANLARELEERLDLETYPVVIAKSGHATVAIQSGANQIFLHSRHQPADEARRLIDAVDLSDK